MRVHLAFAFSYFLLLSSVARMSKRMSFEEISSLPAHGLNALELSVFEGFSVGRFCGLKCEEWLFNSY